MNLSTIMSFLTDNMDLFFLYLCCFVFGFWIFKRLREWGELPPGPWGLPLVGSLPFLNRHHPHLTLTDLAHQFGPIYALKMGNIYTVILSDHKLVRDAFAKENFSGRAPLFLTHGIMQGNGIICAEGALWKDQRKLITTWLKNFGMSKHSLARETLEKRITTGVFEMLENVKKNCDKPVDLSNMITDSLGNVVNEIIFGFKFPPDDKTWHWLRQIQEEGCHEMGVAGVVNFLPFIRYYSSDIRNTFKILQRGQAQTHRFYASIIARRRKMLGLEKPEGVRYPPHDNLFDDHPDGHIKCVKYSKHATTIEEHYFDPMNLILTEGECILDNFLYEQKKRFDEGLETSCYVRDEQLHYLLADMFGAGLDTTSVTISWFFLFMALHQDEQDLVRDEITAVYETDDDIVDGSKLPRLMAAVCEAQRIRSIVPVGIPHGCVKDTFLGKYKIPKGSMVIPLQWAIHMDPDVWEDPDDFKPSRFLAPDGSLLKPQEFIPFQTGKRMCPGDELSRMLVCGLTARLLRRWRLTLDSDVPSEEEMMGTVGVTLSPPHVLYRCEPIA